MQREATDGHTHGKVAVLLIDNVYNTRVADYFLD